MGPNLSFIGPYSQKIPASPIGDQQPFLDYPIVRCFFASQFEDASVQSVHPSIAFNVGFFMPERESKESESSPIMNKEFQNTIILSIFIIRNPVKMSGQPRKYR